MHPSPALTSLFLLPLVLLACSPDAGKDDDPDDADGDGYGADEDCDDDDAAINPGAPEICDGAGVDEDCDGLVDDADDSLDAATLTDFYADGDGDGFGDPASSGRACAQPVGFVMDATDCNDDDPAVNPAATEVCDDAGVDEDCDALVDDADDSVDPATQATYHPDADGDGYGDPDAPFLACILPEDATDDATDCDDTDPGVNPDGQEICDDGAVDEDCDGLVNDADDSLLESSRSTFHTDGDGDGFGDADTMVLACVAPAGAVADDTDCDDTDGAVNPGADEVCDDADVDEDCDGDVDDADASVSATSLLEWFSDADLDGYGDSSSSTWSCEVPSGSVADSTDCDDSDADINPAASERCNGEDDDCDGSVPVDEVDVDLDSCFVCDGDPDDGDSSIGCETIEVVGGTGNDWTTSRYFRANVYSVTTSSTLNEYSVNLGLRSACVLDYYMFEGSSQTGPWTLVWSDSFSVTAGFGMQASGTVDEPMTAGSFYALGVGWNCSATYYADSGTSDSDAGFGTVVGTAWSNSYSGYSTAFNPPNHGGGSTVYHHELNYR